MIEYTSGDILQADAEALVNTVNCVGVMGRGIALQFKHLYPENFKAYKTACEHREVLPGRMFLYETGQLTPPRFIVNFPTKRHWRGTSRIEDIQAGLQDLVKVIQEKGIQSIAIPPLASGLGGLEWEHVKPLIVSALSPLQHVRVILYEPGGAPPAERMVHPEEAPRMTTVRAAIIHLMDRYLSGLLDPHITLLEVHKLLYFLQEMGEPLQLEFKKAHYGPYAEKLRHVLILLEGHYLTGYADGGDLPTKPLWLVPGAVEEAARYLEDRPDLQARFDQVANLVEGFESPFGLELLSSVHWVATHEAVQSLDDLVTQTYAWNDRKQQFSRKQIALAFEVLSRRNMLPDAVLHAG